MCKIIYDGRAYEEFKKIDKLWGEEGEEIMSNFIPFEENLEELEKDQLQKASLFSYLLKAHIRAYKRF